jgi:hypothetical protein
VTVVNRIDHRCPGGRNIRPHFGPSERIAKKPEKKGKILLDRWHLPKSGSAVSAIREGVVNRFAQLFDGNKNGREEIILWYELGSEVG